MKNRFILTPFFLDQPMPGLEQLVQADWLINDPRLPEGTPQFRMSALYESLADLVSSTIRQGELPVSVAGDCCTSLGFLTGLQHAGINPTLINGLIDRLKRANSELGITLFVIEHNMRVIMNLADHIYCLAHGEILAQGAPEEVQNNQLVIDAYLGAH